MTSGAEGKTLAAVAFAYVVLTFVMALPFSLSPGSQILGDVPDAHMYMWTLAWDAHAFLHQPLHIFDANIYYPFANTLAYSENLIGSALISSPLIWLTGNIVLAVNLTALLSCVLCGLGAYVLARRLHISVGGAFVCGLIFAFAPPRFFRMGQLHMTAMQWMPFSLAFLHAYFERGRRRDLLLAIGFFSLQALSSGHGATYLLLATISLIAWQLAWGTPLALRQRLRDAGVAGAYLIAPAVWVVLPYRIAQSEAGLRRGYLSNAHPSLESFLASPSRFHMFLRARFLPPFENEADAYLFPGILVLLLALVAICSWTSRRRASENHVAFYGLLGVLSTLMFVSWPFDLWEQAHWLPGLNFIRIPSRFIILTMLALSVLAGFGVDRVRVVLSKSVGAAATAVIAALLLAEYSAYPFAGVPFTIDPPAIDRWLDTQPKPFTIAEMPSPSPGEHGQLERHQTRSMLHSTAHWQKTIHGYSSLRRPLHDRLYTDLRNFPDATSIGSLRDVGVTHVVVHTEDYGDRWRGIEDQIAKTGAFKLEHIEGSGRVYSLLPRKPLGP
ncbi:MAG TPA: hypothetical protein VM096_02260 [Vicinamibacterales bacterium]|nr:hypothetical protein [Vicinamibacterales bacterium]